MSGGGGGGGGGQPPTKKPHVASFWGRLLDSVPRPAWSSPPEQSGPALTVQVIYEACGQPRTATCVEWSPLLLLKLRCCCRGLRAGKNSAQFYGEVAHALGIRTGLSGSSAQALFGLCCRAHHELRFVHRVAGAGGQVCGGHALHRLLLQAGEVPEWQPNNMDVFVSGCRDMLAPLQYMDPDPQGQIQLPRDPRAPLSCALPNEHPNYCPSFGYPCLSSDTFEDALQHAENMLTALHPGLMVTKKRTAGKPDAGGHWWDADQHGYKPDCSPPTHDSGAPVTGLSWERYTSQDLLLALNEVDAASRRHWEKELSQQLPMLGGHRE
jgi:hypothetical protein